MSRAFANTPQSDVVVDNNRVDLIQYQSSSQWSLSKNFNADVAYQGTFATSNLTGDMATFTFDGTQIGVWAYMPPSASAADFGAPTVTRYTIDGSDPITYQSQYLSSRPVTGAHEQVFQSNILSPGIHVLQVKVIQPGKLQYHLDWVEYNGTTSTGTNSNGNSGSNSNGNSGSNSNGNSGSNSNGNNGQNQNQNQNQSGSSDPDGNNDGEKQNSGSGNESNSTGSSNNTSPSPTGNGSNPQQSLPPSSAAKSVPVSTIAGGAAAGIVLIIGIAILAFWIGRTRRRRRRLRDITQAEATLFKGPDSSERLYADDDDAPAYLTHQRPAVPQKTNSSKQSSSVYTHSDMSTAYDAPLPIPAYATSLLEARPAVAPPNMHMPAHVPMAAAHSIPPLAAPISDYGTTANVTGSAVSSSRSDASLAGTRYRTAQEEKALVYLSESGISRGPGQSSSGEPATGSSGRAGSSSNLPATGEAPPPAYVP